jgi:hypothetical protein
MSLDAHPQLRRQEAIMGSPSISIGWYVDEHTPTSARCKGPLVMNPKIGIAR